MTVLDYQKAFAKILTDRELRGRFFDGETEKLAPLDLDAKQLGALTGLNPFWTGEYSRMLTATRLSTALNVLPFTGKLLPENFIERIIPEYEKKEPPVTAHGSPTVEEVKRFGRFLEDSPEVFESARKYARDVSRYEIALFLLKNEPPESADLAETGNSAIESEDVFLSKKLTVNKKIEILDFDYDVPEILADLKSDVFPDAVEKKTTLIFSPSASTVRVKSVSGAVRLLMKQCGGDLTVREICALFSKQLSKKESGEDVLQKRLAGILRELYESEILIFSG